MFISGLLNCHKHGLHSYVLRDRLDDDHGMVRVFHNTGDSMGSLMDGDQFSIAPHNHRQDIMLYSVLGHVLNVSFAVDRVIHTRDFTEYKFSSAIADGDMGIHPVSTVDLKVSDIRPLTSAGTFLACSAVHTVIAPPGSAWLVVEGSLAPPKHRSLCYGDHRLKFDQKGLYLPMPTYELEMAEWDIGCYVRETVNRLGISLNEAPALIPDEDPAPDARLGPQ